MPISAAFEGTTASVGTTEYSLPNASTTLTPRTEDGVYAPQIGLGNMAGSDEFEFTVYEKIVSGGSQVVYDRRRLLGPQSPPVLEFPPRPLLHGWDVTIKKIAGTDRSFAWSGRGVA